MESTKHALCWGWQELNPCHPDQIGRDTAFALCQLGWGSCGNNDMNKKWLTETFIPHCLSIICWRKIFRNVKVSYDTDFHYWNLFHCLAPYRHDWVQIWFSSSSWLKAKAVSQPIWSGLHGFNSCHPQHEACFVLSTKQYACLCWDFNKANCLSGSLGTLKAWRQIYKKGTSSLPYVSAWIMSDENMYHLLAAASRYRVLSWWQLRTSFKVFT